MVIVVVMAMVMMRSDFGAADAHNGSHHDLQC